MQKLVIAVILLFVIAGLFNCNASVHAAASPKPEPTPIATPTPVVSPTGEDVVVEPVVRHSFLFIPLLTAD